MGSWLDQLETEIPVRRGQLKGHRTHIHYEGNATTAERMQHIIELRKDPDLRTVSDIHRDADELWLDVNEELLTSEDRQELRAQRARELLDVIDRDLEEKRTFLDELPKLVMKAVGDENAQVRIRSVVSQVSKAYSHDVKFLQELASKYPLLLEMGVLE